MATDLSATLRWVLIAIGLLIIVAIYVAALMAQAKASDRSVVKRWLFLLKQGFAFFAGTGKTRHHPSQRITPKISGDKERAAAVSGSAAPASRYLVVVYVQAMEAYPFSGHAIVHAAKRVGLQKSGDQQHGFFQYRPAGYDTVVHITNRVKPGLFAWLKMDTLTTTGLSVFAELQAVEADSALTMMLDCAHQLADTLGGRLLDENHQALTTIKIKSIQKDVRSFFSDQHAKTSSQ